MATPKFIEILADPFTNQTEEFVLILATQGAIPSVRTAPAAGAQITSTGVLLKDAGGNTVVQEVASLGVTSTAAANYYDYFSKSSKYILLIPPGWLMNNHGQAIALQGTLEDLRGYF